MFFSKVKSHLGVDIGTSNIKIVQLRPKDNQFILETYGIVNAAYQISNKDSTEGIKKTAELLKNLTQKSRVTTNKIVASLPNNIVFTSVIEMPPIPGDELQEAVEFEARKYVPLPLEEVALSWSLIKEKIPLINKDSNAARLAEDGESRRGNFQTAPEKQKLLLTAVPNVVIDNYLKVFEKAELEPLALEIEALSLSRSLVGEDTSGALIIDIGAKSSTINLIDNGYLRFSKNLTVGGDTITASIAQSLSINFERAEQFKKDFGLSNQGQQIPQIMRPILDILRNEAQQLISLYESRGNRLSKIVLCGGGAKLPSLSEYLATLGKPVTLANPWQKVLYPPQLKPIIEPIGLNLAVATGLAMRN